MSGIEVQMDYEAELGFTESGELRARRHQLGAVAELGLRAMEKDVDLSALMDEVVALVAENLAVEYAKIFVVQPDGESLLLCSGVGWAEGIVGQATVGTHPDSRAFFLPVGYTLVSEEEPMILEDLPSERRSSGLSLLREREIRSGITAIIHGRERPFGILGADTSRRQRFTIDDVSFLQAVANVLAAAVERRRAPHARAVERPRLRSEFLAEASMLLSSSSNCSSMLANIANLVVPELADWCTVEVLEEGEDIRSVVTHVEPANEDLLCKLQIHHPLDPSNTSSSASEVLRTGRSKLVPAMTDVLSPSAAEDAEDLKMLLELRPTSYMCVPLVTRGRILGVIRLVSAESGRRYGPEDQALAESFARFAALAIENAQLRIPELELARGLIQLANKCYKISVPSNKNENEALTLVPRPSLTSRQLQVLELLSEGKNAKAIGQRLCLSEATIRNHIRSLLQALEARSQLEAVAQAREMGLLN
jgi:GAF domain-containing protein/DNA-binding CsgD family transcriptional regulator